MVLLDGITVEAPLDGTLIVIRNSDQPGLVGEVGMVLGRHGINIATFALGRNFGGAVAIVKVDSAPSAEQRVTTEVLRELQAVDGVQQAAVVTI